MRPPDHPTVERFSFKKVGEMLLDILNLERGIGYTIKWLIIAPQKAIYEYLFEDRKRMVRPFPFLLLVTAIATFLSLKILLPDDNILQFLQNDPDWEKFPPPLQQLLTTIVPHIKRYFNLIFISGLPVTALATYLVFKPAGLNLAEHLVLNTYIYCIQIIGFIFIIPWVKGQVWVAVILAILIYFYIIYAYKKIFALSWAKGFGKFLLVFLISQMMTSLVFVIIFNIYILFSL